MKTRNVTLTQKPLQEITVRLIGTAPILTAHRLPWDVPAYWDNQPAEASKTKIKRASPAQQALLKSVGLNGLAVADYDDTRGLNVYQETILRGHWLPDLSPGFPVSGFAGAITTGAVQYGGKNYGLSAVRLRSMRLFGDATDSSLTRIVTPDVSFDDDIGANSDIKRSPRHIIRIRYALPWETEVRVRFSPSLLDVQGVLQAFAWAGDFGIGQRRPSSPHGGQYGTFRVATEADEVTKTGGER